MTTPIVLFSGPGTGTGKTTLAAGLARLLANRGLDVAPFKVGPDFVDPAFLEQAAGRPARNLDAWLMDEDDVGRALARAANEHDVVVIEGVMGLFDGIDETDRASTAHVASLLDAPVVPVIDVSTMSGTAGAIAHGLVTLDRDIPVEGFVLNNAGSEKHARWARRAVEDATGLPVFGVVPRDEQLTRGERHLGLVTVHEHEDADAFLDRLARAVDEHVDVEGLTDAVARSPRGHPGVVPRDARPRTGPRVRIGVARDEAFNFYYTYNLDALRREGAEIVPFSPLRDDEFPSVDGLYIGGGYPEAYAEELQENTPMREALRQACLAGVPTLAECGGLALLAGELVNREGQAFEMCGVLDATVAFSERLTLGYVDAHVEEPTPLANEGTAFLGHRFHRTRLARDPANATRAYTLKDGPGLVGGKDGWLVENTIAAYTHHHFASTPAWPARFVEACSQTERRIQDEPQP